MKAVSYIALALSIVALALGIYAFTGGFGSAGTAITIPMGGATQANKVSITPTSTSAVAPSAGTSVAVGSTIALTVSTETKDLQVVGKNGKVFATMTVSPVTRIAIGSFEVLDGYLISKLIITTDGNTAFRHDIVTKLPAFNMNDAASESAYVSNAVDTLMGTVDIAKLDSDLKALAGTIPKQGQYNIVIGNHYKELISTPSTIVSGLTVSATEFARWLVYAFNSR